MTRQGIYCLFFGFFSFSISIKAQDSLLVFNGKTSEAFRFTGDLVYNYDSVLVNDSVYKDIICKNYMDVRLDSIIYYELRLSNYTEGYTKTLKEFSHNPYRDNFKTWSIERWSISTKDLNLKRSELEPRHLPVERLGEPYWFLFISSKDLKNYNQVKEWILDDGSSKSLCYTKGSFNVYTASKEIAIKISKEIRASK